MRDEPIGLDAGELAAENAELLPDRSALAFINWLDIDATNKSFALTEDSFLSFNGAGAFQFIITPQI